MPAPSAKDASRGVFANREDVRRTLGDVDDVKVVEILALAPSASMPRDQVMPYAQVGA